MAITLGTVTNLWSISELSGPRPTHTIAGHEWAVECALVAVNFNDQTNNYLQADGATFDPSAMLMARTGKMCIAISGNSVEAGEDNGTLTIGGPISTPSPGVLHCHLYVEDFSTQRASAAWAAAGTWTKDIVFCITYWKLLQ